VKPTGGENEMNTQEKAQELSTDGGDYRVRQKINQIGGREKDFNPGRRRGRERRSGGARPVVLQAN